MNFAFVTPNMTRRARTALLLGCTLAGALGVAQAAPPSDAVTVNASDEIPTVVVRYGDLNLATEAGAKALYKRISVAAQEVCPVNDQRSLAQIAYSHTCRTEAVARAVHEVNSPQLAALQAGRSNRG
jgi:UrcA family protein